MKKKQYIKPSVELINIDIDISLQLQSILPPNGPGEISASDFTIPSNNIMV